MMSFEADKVIEVQHVSKTFRVYQDKNRTLKDRILFSKRNRYSENIVLDDVSFSVCRGEVLGLIGHNGCGKSTTLKLLNKILYPDSGKIIMNGKISSLIELGAGFHPDMTGRENIYINASIFGLKKKEIDKRIDSIIRFSELEQFIDNPVRTYSSGMYMRLAFSIAINVDAEILLVDEILAVGDASFQKKCFDKLRQIKESGTTIVIVSHSMDQIKSICDRVIWLDKGKIKEDGPAQLVCNTYMVYMGDLSSKRTQKELVEQGLSTIEDPNKVFPIREVSEQFGEEARRYGSMDAHFTNIVILNQFDKPTQQFHFKDELNIRFHLTRENHFNKMIHLVFNIVKNGGDVVSSYDSRRGGSRSFNTLQEGKLRIKDIHLAAGDYHIDAFIFDEQGHMMDFLAWLINFEVDTPENYGTGLIAMENEWV